jgi:CheY-like chemotaxis protein
MPSDSTSQSLAGLIILDVEDSDDERGTLAEMLSNHGAVVVTARSIAHSLEVLRCVTPDILLSNIDLPGEEHAGGLIGHVRALVRGNDVRSLAVTTTAEPSGRAAGYQEHLSGAIEPEQLLEAIERLIGRRVAAAYAGASRGPKRGV